MNKGNDMTDLEVTRLCAEAMGYSGVQRKGDHVMDPNGRTVEGVYWPLENDAQAMALVRLFSLRISRMGGNNEGDWAAVWDKPTGLGWKRVGESSGFSKSLNRAICQCVAHIQDAK